MIYNFYMFSQEMRKSVCCQVWEGSAYARRRELG